MGPTYKRKIAATKVHEVNKAKAHAENHKKAKADHAARLAAQTTPAQEVPSAPVKRGTS
jgi:hypothetical protein